MVPPEPRINAARLAHSHTIGNPRFNSTGKRSRSAGGSGRPRPGSTATTPSEAADLRGIGHTLARPPKIMHVSAAGPRRWSTIAVSRNFAIAPRPDQHLFLRTAQLASGERAGDERPPRPPNRPSPLAEFPRKLLSLSLRIDGVARVERPAVWADVREVAAPF